MERRKGPMTRILTKLTEESRQRLLVKDVVTKSLDVSVSIPLFCLISRSVTRWTDSSTCTPTETEDQRSERRRCLRICCLLGTTGRRQKSGNRNLFLRGHNLYNLDFTSLKDRSNRSWCKRPITGYSRCPILKPQSSRMNYLIYSLLIESVLSNLIHCPLLLVSTETPSGTQTTVRG